MPVLRLLGDVLLTTTRTAAALTAAWDAGLRAALPAAEHAWAQSAPTTTAVLIDLDNLGVKRTQLDHTLYRVLTHARPYVTAIAAGHPDATERIRDSCARLDIDVLDTDGSPNAADHALLAVAAELYATGRATDFFVASHDKAFADLPGKFTLLVTGTAKPARALLETAQAVEWVA